MKKSGAPIEWVKNADPVFVTLSPVAVAAKARDPNAAKLLMDFCSFREAQLVLRNANRFSGRSDVEPLGAEMHPSKLKIAAIDPTVGEELRITARVIFSTRWRQAYGCIAENAAVLDAQCLDPALLPQCEADEKAEFD
jgi:ABC-type Fe3+ transport system substrate-binding protein